MCKKRSLFLSLLAGGLLVLLVPALTLAAYGDSRTAIGKTYAGDGEDAAEAYLDTPKGFTLGPDGNIYIADTTNNVIRRINGRTNKIEKYAGTGEFGKQDGFRHYAQFGYPEAIVVDGLDRVFIADTLNNRIRKIDGNEVSTIVGDGLAQPRGLMIRGEDLYIADTGHNRILRTKLNGGPVIEVAKNFSTPTKMTWRGQFLYVANAGNNSIEQIDLFGQSARQRIAGGFADLGGIQVNGTDLYAVAGAQGVFNEIYRIDLRTKEKELLQQRRETEMLNWASDMFFKRNADGQATMYVLFKGGSSIHSFDLNGENEQLVAGKHRYGNKFGHLSEALIGRPQALELSADSYKLYLSENNKIAELNLITGNLREVAGHAMDSYTEGTGSEVRFSDVTDMAASSDGQTLYLVDRNNHRIRKLNVATGETTYITGAGEVNAYNSNNGYQEGGPCPDTYETGVAGCAYFNRPTGIALSPDEKTLYIAEGSNNRIRGVHVDSGHTFHIAGTGEAGYVNGFGPWSKFNGPFTLAISDDGRTLYVADKYNHSIREINLETKNVTTLVNRKGLPGYKEGHVSEALLSIPEYIEVGANGDIFFSEAGNLRVRAVNIASRHTRLVSGSGTRGLANGNKDTTRWTGPKGMAVRGDWLFVTDFYSDRIKLVNLR
ncbi:hypothetical protein KJ903_02255 [Patescibacteria group bacterium]|nr:hypothetical protein [Patescibacteria group bacterium]